MACKPLLILVVIAAGWLNALRCAAAASALELAEVDKCRRNLQLIYQAIQAYRRVYQEWPDSLAELRPQFLAETKVLICPTAQRVGLTSQDVTEWPASGVSTYDYEFSESPIPAIISGGSRHTMREWKRLQIGLIGSDVPVLRCHTHASAVLNLTFGGRVTENGEVDWEPIFNDVIDRDRLSSTRCLADYLVQKIVVVPRRAQAAASNLVDLSSCYTMALDEVWPGEESSRPLASVPIGANDFHGTAFDLRGAVQLRALQPGLIQYADRVEGIRLERAARTVHFLAGAARPVIEGRLVAELNFHFANGQQERMKLRYGKDLSACVLPLATGVAPTLDVAWSGKTSPGQVARLYHCRWTNPFPAQVVRTLDFVARDKQAGPLLFAVTVEAPD